MFLEKKKFIKLFNQIMYINEEVFLNLVALHFSIMLAANFKPVSFSSTKNPPLDGQMQDLFSPNNKFYG